MVYNETSNTTKDTLENAPFTKFINSLQNKLFVSHVHFYIGW